jgi:hypothetical protein
MTKRAYLTEEQARFPGQDIYLCLYCGNWHRTTPKSKKRKFTKQQRQKYYERRIQHRSHQLRAA